MTLRFAFDWLRSRIRAEIRKSRGTIEYPFRRRAIERHLEVLRPAPDSPRGPGACVVTAVIRDAEHLVEPFLEHYLRLGAGEIVLLDNGSEDGTVDGALAFDRVTVLRCRLPFKHYDSAFKRFLIERYGAGRWCLTADADELFDYPASDRLPLAGLLDYLNRNGYTAMPAVMLELFPDGPVETWPADGRELLEAARWYHPSGIVASLPWRLRLTNRFADPTMPFYRGGRMYQLCGVRTVLTKFPLVYYVPGGKLSLRRIGHFVRGAHIADVYGVLRHYKFDRSFRERWIRLAERGQHYDRARVYRAGLRALDLAAPALRGPTARRLDHVDQLVEEGLLRASAAYREFVRIYQGPSTGSGRCGCR